MKTVTLYRLENGELTATPCDPEVVPMMNMHEWAATACRTSEGIDVTVVHGDRDRKLGRWLLVDLVRGDLQE